MPKYTVEPPYTDEVRQFYVDLATNDETISFAEVDIGPIFNKCINIDGENTTLIDRPEQELTGELVGNIFTVSNLKPNSLLIVDNGNNFELDESTTLDLDLDTPGIYTLQFIKLPYQDQILTVTYDA